MVVLLFGNIDIGFGEIVESGISLSKSWTETSGESSFESISGSILIGIGSDVDGVGDGAWRFVSGCSGVSSEAPLFMQLGGVNDNGDGDGGGVTVAVMINLSVMIALIFSHMALWLAHFFMSLIHDAQM